MDVYEAIKTRRSVRAYQDKPVPEEVLDRILEAARWAPSARNLQPYKFVIVEDPEVRRQLGVAADDQAFVGQAPVVIAAVTSDPDRVMSCEVPPYAVDAAIALDHLTLAAASEGLGTCWIGAFSQPRVRKILSVPDSHKVVSLMPLGYPADNEAPRTRKSRDELVSIDRFE
ncbi:MAG: nitroreductase family protein [Candidatus Latescibacteria bacterium]|jgi:nitroreductase|nr:nitroreductase family protein [Candidatus Latescibacterota bacterium]